MSRTKRVLAVAVTCLTAGLVYAGPVLESIPSDALLAAKVSDLRATSGKIAKLSQDLGIAVFIPSLQDPLSMLKGQTRIQKGLKEDGELGFALLRPVDGNAFPGMIVLIPITSFADLLSNFPNARVEGGVAEVTFPGDDSPSFLADWGDYAALSNEANRVATKPKQTLKPQGVVGKDSRNQDLFLYVNFSEISPDLLVTLDQRMARENNKLDREIEALPEKWRPVIRATVNQVFNVAKSFLRDADTASIGINISDAGINFSVINEFKPQSYLGNACATIRGTDQSLTTGLPDIKYLVVSGLSADPGPVAKIVDDLTRPILEELDKVEGEEKAKALTQYLMSSIRSTKGSVIGVPSPTKIGQEGIFQSVTIYRGSGKDLKSTLDLSGELMTNLFKDIKAQHTQENPDIPVPFGDVIVTPNARTVDGVTFNTIKFVTPQNPDDPAAVQTEMMMSMLYGGEGLNYSYAEMNGDFIWAQSASDETISKFITAFKTGQDSLSKLDHIKVVAAELPKVRVYESFIMLDEFINTGIGIAGTFGMQAPVQLPPNLPPLGISMGFDGSAIRINAHLPRKTVQQIVSAAMQVMMQMQGGGGGQL